MRNLKISFNFLAIAITLPFLALADNEGMPNMKIIKPKKSYSVTSKDQGDQLQDDRGFGDKEPEVRMMNLMMVEGSGYEGMDMGEMKMADHMAMNDHVATNDQKGMKESSAEIIMPKSPSNPKVGANLYEFDIKDPKTGKALAGLKLTSQVFMTSMDMGTETPRVKELTAGHYQVKAVFSMKGPWALKIILPKGEKVFEFNVGNSP